MFGSSLGSFQNETIQFYFEIFTYTSFLLFGLFGFLPKRKNLSNDNSVTKHTKVSILQKVSNFKMNCIFIVALNIMLGEFGDKTFLASLGLGLQYPKYKLFLILGSIFGMVCSNSIALFFGRFLGNRFKPSLVEFLSNLMFIIFGLVGFFNLFF